MARIPHPKHIAERYPPFGTVRMTSGQALGIVANLIREASTIRSPRDDHNPVERRESVPRRGVAGGMGGRALRQGPG